MARLEYPIELTFNIFKEHSSKNLQIIFDRLNNEHPESINIKAYDRSGNFKFQENVTVDSHTLVYQNNYLENTSKIIITIDNWNTLNRRVRMSEVGFDIPIETITLDNMYDEPQIKINTEIKEVKVIFDNRETKSRETYSLVTEIDDGKIYEIYNPLIMNVEQARSVAEWILKEESRNAEFTINWRQNPALTLWDKVEIENGYNTQNPSNIIRQEFEYAGYLQGITKTRGVIKWNG